MSSAASSWGIRGVDAERVGICKVGTVGVAALVGTEDEEIVAEDWQGCPLIGAFEVFPIAMAACNSKVSAKNQPHQNSFTNI